jgi:hypothetical protein
MCTDGPLLVHRCYYNSKLNLLCILVILVESKLCSKACQAKINSKLNSSINSKINSSIKNASSFLTDSNRDKECINSHI